MITLYYPYRRGSPVGQNYIFRIGKYATVPFLNEFGNVLADHIDSRAVTVGT